MTLFAKSTPDSHPSHRKDTMTAFASRHPPTPHARRHAARALLAATAALAGAGADAADFSIGIGAGADRGRVECVASFPCDRASAYGKLFAGYRLREAVEVQAVFFDAGRFDGGGTTPGGTAFGGRFEVRGFGVTGGYRWSIAPSWSVVARAGIASVRTRFEHATPGVADVGMTTVQPLVGFGVAYALTSAVSLSADADATRFKVHTSRGPLQMLGLAVQVSF